MGGELKALHSELRQVRQELSELRQSILRRRLSKSALAGQKLDDIVKLMLERLNGYWYDVRQPMQLHYLVRVYGKRLAAIGSTSEEALEQLKQSAKVFVSATGGTMLVPLQAWEEASPDQQAIWRNTTPRMLQKQREQNIHVAQLFSATERTLAMEEHAPGAQPEQPAEAFPSAPEESAQEAASPPSSPGLTDPAPTANPAPEGTLAHGTIDTGPRAPSAQIHSEAQAPAPAPSETTEPA